MEDDIFNDSAITDTFCSDGHDPIEEIHDSGIIYADDMILSSEENSIEEMMLPTQEDDMILSIEVNVIEEMMLPTQEEFNINVKSNVLTSTDPTESLADRLDKISTPSQSLTASF